MSEISTDRVLSPLSEYSAGYTRIGQSWATLIDAESPQADDSVTNTEALPDLSVSNLQVNVPTWHELDEISVSWDVDNSGLAASGAFEMQLYLSTDATITTSDILISGHNGASIAPDSSLAADSSWIMILPQDVGLPEGTYYIGVIVDPNDLIAESDETNNVSVAIEVTLSNTTVNYEGTEFADFWIGTAENDTINGYGGDDIFAGGDGDDLINGHDGDNFLFGQGGEDEIWGGENNDIISGGADADWMFGADGRDIILGGDGNDVLLGSDGNDILLGQDGDDYLGDGFGSNILIGGAGDDVLEGSDGINIYVYDDGLDTILNFNLATSTVILDAQALGIEGLSTQEVVDQHGTTISGHAALNFGDGDVLFFQDFEDITQVTDILLLI